MNIPSSLIAKGLAGAAAVAASVGVAANWDKISGLFGNTTAAALSETEILSEAGLNCKTNSQCTLIGGKTIKIKQGETTSGEITSLSASSGKIKLHKGISGYEHNLKFVIEGGDITVADTSITKLERDETYEIKKDGEEWILLRKSTTLEEINKKLIGLGLPDDCVLAENDTNPKVCGTLGEGKLKSINFEGRKSSIEGNISGAENVTLKLEKTDDREVFPDGVKIIFEASADVNVPKEGSNSGNILLKRGTGLEFKIKNGEKKIKKAWSIEKLTKKIGLINCATDSNASEKTCDLPSNKKINVFKEIGNHIINADLTGEESKKIKFDVNQENHYQGFKFFVDTEISLQATDATKEGTVDKIENATSGTSSYEIKEQTISGVKYWFLSKKAN